MSSEQMLENYRRQVEAADSFPDCKQGQSFWHHSPQHVFGIKAHPDKGPAGIGKGRCNPKTGIC